MKKTQEYFISKLDTHSRLGYLMMYLNQGYKIVDATVENYGITFLLVCDVETKSEAIERLLKRNWVDIDRELGTDTWDNNVQPFVTALLEYLKGLPDE